MLTPKEKADDLITDFKNIEWVNEISGIEHGIESDNAIKECSLYVINEILKVLEKEQLELFEQARNCKINMGLQEYYLQVKKEIIDYDFSISCQ